MDLGYGEKIVIRLLVAMLGVIVSFMAAGETYLVAGLQAALVSLLVMVGMIALLTILGIRKTIQVEKMREKQMEN